LLRLSAEKITVGSVFFFETEKTEKPTFGSEEKTEKPTFGSEKKNEKPIFGFARKKEMKSQFSVLKTKNNKTAFGLEKLKIPPPSPQPLIVS